MKFGADWTLHVYVSVKQENFLLPAGGAIYLTEHWHVDVFIQYF